MLIKYGTGFIIALEIDDKSVDVKFAFAYVSDGKKGTLPSHFLANPTFDFISTTKSRLSNPQTAGGQNEFLEFLF